MLEHAISRCRPLNISAIFDELLVGRSGVFILLLALLLGLPELGALFRSVAKRFEKAGKWHIALYLVVDLRLEGAIHALTYVGRGRCQLWSTAPALQRSLA